jgi:ribonuclease BN (tRNA processing enzyme)
MRLTVLGGCGAWPGAGQACGGYLVEHDGYRLLLDPGYATLPRLLGHLDAARLDAVYVSHGHPDHCADLNPLLRARTLRADPAPPLPVYAPPDALSAVLALDRPGLLDAALRLHEFAAGQRLAIGPFQATTRPLPHSVPDAGLRLSAGGRVLAYTGDSGPSAAVVELADGADVLLAEASFVDSVPEPARNHLCSAVEAGRQAARAGVRRLVLTHLLPGTDPAAARAAGSRSYPGIVEIATGGLAVDI